MKRAATFIQSTKAAIYLQMILGMFLAFVGNEMVGHASVLSGMMLMIAATACVLTAMYSLFHLRKTANVQPLSKPIND